MQPRERRLMELCGFIVAQVNRRRKRRITIVIDGDHFGIGSIEEILNPRGNIPVVSGMRAPTGGPIDEIAFCN